MLRSLVGSEMCIRDRYQRRVRGRHSWAMRFLRLLHPAVRLARPAPSIPSGLRPPSHFVHRIQGVRSFSSLPPHMVHGLPALSPTMEQGNLAEWLVQEGDSFGPGDVLARIETDKATVDLEAQDDGIVAKILVPAGTNDLAVGAPIFVTVEDEEDVGSFTNFDDSSTGDAQPEAAAEAPPAPAAPAPAAPAASYPSHRIEGLPALSPTMEQGNLAEWLVQEGDSFGPGDVLARIETDKATVDLEAQDDGIVAKILMPAGSDGVDVGAAIMVVVEDEEDITAFATFDPNAAPAAASPAPAAASPATPTAPAATPARSSSSSGGRVMASPFARKTALERGIDLAAITGSGPGGRIVVRDVLAPGAPAAQTVAAVTAPTPAPTQQAATPTPAPAAPADPGVGYTDVPNTQMRKVIAKRLCESKQTIPHYYLSVECELDALMDLRVQMREEHDAKVSVNDFVVKASACALKQVPQVNAQWGEDAIRYLDNVDVCVAVATEGGLVTPIVTDVPARGLTDISSTVRDLATRARDGKLQPSEMIGGTFTVSNLGMFGVSHFTSIINPPQVAILAVGGSVPRVLPDGTDEDGVPQFRVASTMTVTLSCDHRVVDGAVGAQWLQAFKGYIENPLKMIL
eukprot:TRINITY_DN553_c0_g1_i3.p1 TRINITY_DN553_c0_g1~~TRINITY_DN553_c0_g1_i3.p1  ORF type:complete len:629 (+),score=172.45 TRINITY_DN553_c0_g1_i3:136-2022(+)